MFRPQLCQGRAHNGRRGPQGDAAAGASPARVLSFRQKHPDEAVTRLRPRRLPRWPRGSPSYPLCPEFISVPVTLIKGTFVGAVVVIVAVLFHPSVAARYTFINPASLAAMLSRRSSPAAPILSGSHRLCSPVRASVLIHPSSGVSSLATTRRMLQQRPAPHRSPLMELPRKENQAPSRTTNAGNADPGREHTSHHGAIARQIGGNVQCLFAPVCCATG